MAATLDVYRDWLGIVERRRPLNYYQLLRLPLFEDDIAKIRDQYRDLNAHVRKFATGDYAVQSQQLLNELAQAMLCLTDSGRKREYDASLGRKDRREKRHHTFEELLLGAKLINRQQLEKARALSDQIGLPLRDCVLQQKSASSEAIMQAYAESLGLPYLDTSDISVDDLNIDEALINSVPSLTVRQHSCMPIMIEDGQLIMVSPNPLVPLVEEDLRLRLGFPVRTALCTPGFLSDLIDRYYPIDADSAVPLAVRRAIAAKKAEEGGPSGANSEEGPGTGVGDVRLVAWAIGCAIGFVGYLVYYYMNDPFPDFTAFETWGMAFLVGLVVGGLGFAIGSAKQT